MNTIEKQARVERGLLEKKGEVKRALQPSPFLSRIPLAADPVYRPAAFLIVSTDREPGTCDNCFVRHWAQSLAGFAYMSLLMSLLFFQLTLDSQLGTIKLSCSWNNYCYNLIYVVTILSVRTDRFITTGYFNLWRTLQKLVNHSSLDSDLRVSILPCGVLLKYETVIEPFSQICSWTRQH